MLTDDITLTQEDATTYVSGTTTHGIYVQTLNTLLDGNGHKISFEYTIDSTVVTRFSGLFMTVNNKITNVVIEARINGGEKYSYGICNTLAKNAVIENSLLDVQFNGYSSSYGSYIAVIGSLHGLARNNIIVANKVTSAGAKSGLAVHLYNNNKTGLLKNIAYICSTNVRTYYNRGSSSSPYITGQFLDNVVRYTSIDNFISANGLHWTTEKNDSGSWTSTDVDTPITEPQDIGSAWTVITTENATTENPAGIKLNGKYVYTVA